MIQEIKQKKYNSYITPYISFMKLYNERLTKYLKKISKKERVKNDTRNRNT